MRLKVGIGAILTAVLVASADVPEMISYQGRVAVNGTNFTGTGQFKFALVDAGTNTLWSNDGTSVDGSEPSSAIPLEVSRGLYSVLLGDGPKPIPAGVFGNETVLLRVWFDDGVHGSQRLTPDRRIAPVGYAMVAADVPAGAITEADLASGAVSADKIAAGAVGSEQLADGAAAANLAAGNQSAVPSGGMILSASSSNDDLAGVGYVKIGRVDLGDVWERRASGSPPVGRSTHVAVWTGSEMIVWGGTSGSGKLDDGARYDPAVDSWTAVSTTDAPAGRIYATAVWTGDEMIVWGGQIGGGYADDGGRYNPATDTWTPVTTTGAPSERSSHTAVWTGTKMIVWGGYNGNIRIAS